jgi:hypothetical protein
LTEQDRWINVRGPVTAKVKRMAKANSDPPRTPEEAKARLKEDSELFRKYAAIAHNRSPSGFRHPNSKADHGPSIINDSVTITFTRAEALALDALVTYSAERLFIDKNGGAPYALETWTKETAARACDKLHASLMPDDYPENQTWTYLLSMQEE